MADEKDVDLTTIEAVKAAPPVDPWAVSKVENARWGDAARTYILCDVTFPNHALHDGASFPFTAMPSDVMPHGKQLYADLLRGKYGAIADYAPDLVALAAAARGQRDTLMAASDWTQLPDVPAGTAATWATYRQALRDVTKQPGFPVDINWPVQPA